MPDLYSQYPADVAGRTPQLEHEMLFHFFGVPLIVASDSTSVMEHVDAALGRWKSLPTSYREDIPPRRLEILVTKSMSPEVKGHSCNLAWRGRGRMLMVSGPGLAGSAAESAGMVFVAPEWTNMGRAFADMVVTPLAVFLASESLSEDRVFLRASVFVHGDAALALLADSESARLKLAGGLHRAGFEMLASDFLLAARHPARGLELWGHPSAIPHVPAAASAPNSDRRPAPTGWTALPMEGGAKVHLQHVGSVLLAVLDEAAPGPENDMFPAPFDADPGAMQQRLGSKSSLHYPPPLGADALLLPPESDSILAELARAQAVRLPSAEAESMLPALLRRLAAISC